MEELTPPNVPTETAIEAASPEPKVVENVPSQQQEDISKEIERKAKLEAYLTSGFGYGKKKQQLLKAFWDIVWSELEKAGWKKSEGVGTDEGSITFFPPGSNGTKTGKRNVNYYDRIRDLLDRVLERRNPEETTIAEAFQKNQEEGAPKPRTSTRQISRPRRAATQAADNSGASTRPKVIVAPIMTTGTIDLSWKDGGSSYPKHSSRVGEKYQATELPAAGTNFLLESYSMKDRLWHGENPGGNAFMELVLKQVPHNKREQAFEWIAHHFHNIDCTGLTIADLTIAEVDSVEKIPVTPWDGSNWTSEEHEKFRMEMFRLRKDICAVAKVMGKDVNTCMTYYLNKYKKSDNYRLLKTVRVYERHEKVSSEDHEVDACAICGDGGSLLICDGCEGEYHMGCLRPELKAVPEGHWECDECVDRKLLKTRENIIMKSSLYETFRKPERKRTIDEVTPDNPSADSRSLSSFEGDTIMKPSPAILDRMKRFAKDISCAMTIEETKDRSTIEAGMKDGVGIEGRTV